MKNLFGAIVSPFKKERIEIALAICVVWALLTYLLYIFLINEKYDQVVSLLSPFIISIGVIIALDNLITSEKNRHKDKDREESRFRFDICIGQLEKLSEVLQPRTSSYGEGSSLFSYSGWDLQQLNKAKVLIDSYSELKLGVLNEHLQALNIEESIYKSSLLAQAASHSGYDYFQLLDQGCSSDSIEERLCRHNKRLLELAEEPDGKNFSYWDTNDYNKLPRSLNPNLLLGIVWFFLPKNEYEQFSDGIHIQDVVCILEESGLHGIADYFLWSMTVTRKHDGMLTLMKKIEEQLKPMAR